MMKLFALVLLVVSVQAFGDPRQAAFDALAHSCNAIHSEGHLEDAVKARAEICAEAEAEAGGIISVEAEACIKAELTVEFCAAWFIDIHADIDALIHVCLEHHHIHIHAFAEVAVEVEAQLSVAIRACVRAWVTAKAKANAAGIVKVGAKVKADVGAHVEAYVQAVANLRAELRVLADLLGLRLPRF